MTNNTIPRTSSIWIVGAALSASLCTSLTFAADLQPSVVIESEGVVITTVDLEAELKKAPPNVRKSLLTRKEAVAQLATNLLVRRVLAKQAEMDGAASNPVEQATLQLARDRVLSDLQLLRLDQSNKPTDAVLEQRAKELYKAEPKRFEIPEQIRASHILVLGTDEDAEKKAEAILADLKAGADFSEQAKTKSKDPGSAEKGGDLGFFTRGRMVKEFEEKAFSMKPGEMSELVKSQFGFHIIKLIERKEADMRSYADVREDLLKEVLQKFLNDARLKLGDQIMSKAKAHPENLETFVTDQSDK